MHPKQPFSRQLKSLCLSSQKIPSFASQKVREGFGFPPQCSRCFSSSNLKSSCKSWRVSQWKSEQSRPSTEEESKSLKEPSRLSEVPVRSFLPYLTHTRSALDGNWRVTWRHIWTGFDVVILVAVAYITYQGYYYDRSVLNPRLFTPFLIVSKEKVSPTSFIITLRPEPYAINPKLAQADPYAKEWRRGTWSVEFKQPQLQIARSYTPLPPREDDKPGDMRFFIRKEASGEMSRYIARLAEGDKLELRGPHTEVELPADVAEVLFFAGGTGIAPALQVAHTLLKFRVRSEALPVIHIVWANRRREDCIGGTNPLVAAAATHRVDGTIVQELRNLQRKYPDNIRVDCVVDEERSFLDQRMISQLTRRSSHLAPEASRLLFVSGPDGFIEFLAGPKKYQDGKQVQGELGGLIRRVGTRGWEVWKH